VLGCTPSKGVRFVTRLTVPSVKSDLCDVIRADHSSRLKDDLKRLDLCGVKDKNPQGGPYVICGDEVTQA
jgi:hypothetical protein